METHAASGNRGSDVLQASKTVPGKPGASNPLWGPAQPSPGPNCCWGLSSLNRPPSASPEKTRPQKFQPKVATNYHCSQNWFCCCCCCCFLPHGAFLSTRGGGGWGGWAIRHSATKKQRTMERTRKGLPSPCKPVSTCPTVEGKPSMERPQGIATKIQKNHKCVK